MSTLKPASWTYAEDFVPEPEVVEAARRRGLEFGDATPVGTGAGAMLRFVAASISAHLSGRISACLASQSKVYMNPPVNEHGLHRRPGTRLPAIKMDHQVRGQLPF